MDAFRLKASEDVASESSFLLERGGDSCTRIAHSFLGTDKKKKKGNHYCIEFPLLERRQLNL
jgi:hypothetical protein